MKKLVAILVILLILFGVHIEKPADNIGDENNYFREKLALISVTPESPPSPDIDGALSQKHDSENKTGLEVSETSENKETVYITEHGTRYHKDGCKYLRNSKIPIELSDAVISYKPCQICKPPELV